jgi:hypothetical protein
MLDIFIFTFFLIYGVMNKPSDVASAMIDIFNALHNDVKNVIQEIWD